MLPLVTDVEATGAYMYMNFTTREGENLLKADAPCLTLNAETGFLNPFYP
jgi:hypothetical protein